MKIFATVVRTERRTFIVSDDMTQNHDLLICTNPSIREVERLVVEHFGDRPFTIETTMELESIRKCDED